MSEAKTPIINLADVQMRDVSHGERFSARVGSMTNAIGLKGLGAMLHEVPAGKTAFPFHAHHVASEMFIILEGEGTYRCGERRFPIKAMDVISAPNGGAETAHHIINSGDTPLKYIGISANPTQTDVVEYPDSSKFAVLSRFDWATYSGGVRHIGRLGKSLDYWDGEDSGDNQ